MPSNTNLYQKFGRTLDAGEVIFEEGETGDQIFIIQKGKVRISKKMGDKTHILAVLGKGDFFGEMAIVNNVKRTATATAVMASVLLCFNREGFINMINKNAQIAMNIIDKLCRRLQNMNMQIKHMVKKNAQGLVALNLYYAFKEAGPDFPYLEEERTLNNIAYELELPVEQVRTFLLTLQDRNIIEMRDEKIYLADREKLNRFVEKVN
jgi:CRP/FNR family cyclic AMP-dependent transcriptional regulator